MLQQLVRRYPVIRRRILSPFVVDVNPNMVTLLSLLCGVFSGYFFFTRSFALAALFLFLNGFLDVLDGEIAKKGRPTKRGDFLDHTSDRVSDVLIYFGLAYSGLVSADLVFLTLVCLLLVSYLGTQAQALTKERMYGGIAGRSDRHVILFFGALGMYVFPGALVYSVYLILLLSLVTFFQRFFGIYRKLGK